MSSRKTVKKIVLVVIVLIAIILGIIIDRQVDLPFLRRTIVNQKETTVQLTNEESITINIVKSVSPAVVTIGINQQNGENQIESDIGSGFIVDKDGLIITNKHVVADLDSHYQVILADESVFDVVDIYRDPANDLAILKIEASNLPIVSLGNSDNLVVGQFSLAIGTALGEFRQTVTSGIISGLGRGVTTGSVYLGYVERLDNVIQTDAAINPGNSGGPLLNSAGQVIGINVAVAQDADNISFAIPINIAQAMLDNFYQTGEFDRPFLGVRYAQITQTIADLNQIPQGAYILAIIDNSPATQTAMVPGDIIITIDDQAINEVSGGIAGIIDQKSLGQTVKIRYYHQGEYLDTTVKLTSQE